MSTIERTLNQEFLTIVKFTRCILEVWPNYLYVCYIPITLFILSKILKKDVSRYVHHKLVFSESSYRQNRFVNVVYYHYCYYYKTNFYL